jgi:hypothetical protein
MGMLPWWQRVRIYALTLRSRLLQQYDKLGLAKTDAAVLAALTLGEKSGISKETRQAFSVSGASHVLAYPVIEVADDGKTARSWYLTPGTMMNRFGRDGKHRSGGWLWERYGSDFVYHDGKWWWAHEQVCPDMGGSFDDGNSAQSKYDQLANPKAGPGGPPPGGAAREPLLDPPESGTGLWLQDGGPLHTDYTPIQTIQNSVPFPVPYKTMDDDNTYTKRK